MPWLACLLLLLPFAPRLAAQDALPVRVLLHGERGDPEPRVRTARSAAEWAGIVAAERLPDPAAALAVDYARELLVVLWYGAGRGGVPELGLLQSPVERPNRLLRLAGAAAAPVVAGRWVVLALPTAWEPWRQSVGFETDAEAAPGVAAWRSVLPPRLPLVLGAVQNLPADAGAPVQVFQDAVALRRFWRTHAAAWPIPEYDYRQVVVLVVAGDDASLYTMTGSEPGRGAGAPPRQTLTMVRRWQPAPKPGAPAAHQFGWFVLARREGALDFETPRVGATDTFDVVARFVVASPRPSPTLQVLRCFECELEARADTLCERATTPREWAALRAQVGGKVAGLPDDWADFEHDHVVVVALAAAVVAPGLQLAVLEEEGVDVLTIEAVAAAGRAAVGRSLGLVLKVPQRKGQLAIVHKGPAAAPERTLRVFPGH